jgi:hypothetical protein
MPFCSGVGWEGGDEWVRAQFRFYLAGLLRTSLEGRDRPEMHLYNSHYMAALDSARWYQAWARNPPPAAIAQLPPGEFNCEALGFSPAVSSIFWLSFEPFLTMTTVYYCKSKLFAVNS